MLFAVIADQRLLYMDASALVKLIRAEPETPHLAEYIDHCAMVSSMIVLTEIPRAIRRALHDNPGLPKDRLLSNAKALLDALALVPLSRDLLAIAGAIPDAERRSLDAIHIASAAVANEVDAFVTYDRRQMQVADRTGLSIASPGA
jgi:predicted nucleic acid-binding protein